MVLVSAELNMLEASVKEIVICLMYQYITTTTNFFKNLYIEIKMSLP